MSRTFDSLGEKLGIGRHPVLWILFAGVFLHLLFGLSAQLFDTDFWAIVIRNKEVSEGIYGLEGYYYTPIWGYFLGFVSFLQDTFLSLGEVGVRVYDAILPIEGGTEYLRATATTLSFNLSIKIPLLLIDLGIGWICRLIVLEWTEDEKRANLAFAAAFISPILLVSSGINAMPDTIAALFMISAVYLVSKDRYLLAGTTYTLAVMTKFFPIFMFPILVAYVLGKHRGNLRMAGFCLLKAAIPAVAGIVIVLFPQLSAGNVADAFSFLTDRLQGAGGGSDAVSMLVGYSRFLSYLLITVAEFAVGWFTYRKIAKGDGSSTAILFGSATLSMAIAMLYPPATQYLCVIVPLLAIRWGATGHGAKAWWLLAVGATIMNLAGLPVKLLGTSVELGFPSIDMLVSTFESMLVGGNVTNLYNTFFAVGAVIQYTGVMMVTWSVIRPYMDSRLRNPDVKSHGKFASRVSGNVLTNVVLASVVALIGIVMTPFYIDKFGLSVYGLLPLTLTVCNFIMVATDPLANVFGRYLAIAIQGDDWNEANKIFSTSFFGMMKVALLCLPLCIIIAILSPELFSTGGAVDIDVQILFAAIMLSTLVTAVSSSFSGVFRSINRLDINYATRTVYYLFQVALVMLLFLMDRPSLSMVGVSYLSASILMTLLMGAFIPRLCPQLRISRDRYTKGALKEMTGLCMWASFSQLGSLLFIEASLIIVNMNLGSESQASFSIVANLISMVDTATNALANSSTPLLYKCYADGDDAGTRKTLNLFMKVIGVVMAFPVAFVMIFTPEVITAWLGTGYDNLYELLYLVLPVQLAMCTLKPMIFVPVVYAKSRTQAVVTAAIGVFNIIATLLVTVFTDWGLIAVVAVWCISMGGLRLVFFPIYVSRLTRCEWHTYYRPLAYSMTAFVLVLAVGQFISPYASIPAMWSTVVPAFFTGFIIYMGMTTVFVLEREERSMVLSYLPLRVQKPIMKLIEKIHPETPRKHRFAYGGRAVRYYNYMHHCVESMDCRGHAPTKGDIDDQTGSDSCGGPRVQIGEQDERHAERLP